jgi:hypothetical protein
MSRKLRLPSPALVVASIALVVALTGTAVAANVVPLAKRALVADNAKKLGGQTSSQLVSRASEAAGPASTAVGLITVKTAPFSLGAQQGGDFTVTCDPGQKAISGGYDNPTGVALGWDSRPTADGTGWASYLSSSSGGSGNVYAICLK